MRSGITGRVANGVALLALSAALSACGGGGGGSVASTPVPPSSPPVAPPPPPPPPPASPNDSAEYRSSNAPVKAQALAAYDAGATGTGVIVGVVDSGISLASAEFTGRIHPNSKDIAANRGLGDEGGHGTAVSSVLLGARNDVGTHGVAYNATLLVLRTDTVGSCANTDPEKGCTHNDNNIARGVDLARTTGAKVINMSLGGSPPNATLRAAIDRATAAGIIIVISAGNDRDTDPVAGANPDLFAQVANDPVARGLVIIAGAIDSSSNITAFSNLAGNSSAHYITALGRRVLSIDQNGTQFFYSGTSFAAPVVSGAIALLAQAFPTLTPAQLVDLLYRSATDLGTAGDDTTYGQGEVNLARAFQPQGQTSLAGSAVPVSLTNNGTLSAAMGDAAKTGTQAVIQDIYGRAFTVDLAGTVARAPVDRKLAPSLSIGTRSMLAQGGATGIALSIGARPGRGAVERLLLAPHERDQARALAGSVISRLGRDMQLGFAVSRKSGALVDEMTLARGAAFIAADRAADSWGFLQRPDTAFAVAHQLAGFDVQFSAEKGAARLWESAVAQAGRSDYRRYGYAQMMAGVERRLGAVSFGGRVTYLDEKETTLGARFSPLIGNGAQSVFADALLRWSPDADWRMAAGWRQGWTQMAPGGIRQTTDRLQSTAWSFDVAKRRVLTGTDSLSLRMAQPLRISKGGLDLSVPLGFEYGAGVTQSGISRLNLAPSGREMDVEAAYSLPLTHGFAGANLYWRKQPGHIATAPDDVGAALQFSIAF